jgi:hypothetical protein
MNKFLLFLATIVIVLSLASCKKDDLSSTQIEIKATVETGSSSIAFVRAEISGYVLASAKFENNSFEMSFPATVPAKHLMTYKTEGVSLSNSRAKLGRVFIRAYNESGQWIGSFDLAAGLEWAIEYVYADRSFTEKGKTSYGFVYDCSYQKGWNIVYMEYWGRTTKKPSNQNFKWSYSPLAF